jgi:hypothetical protein
VLSARDPQASPFVLASALKTLWNPLLFAALAVPAGEDAVLGPAATAGGGSARLCTTFIDLLSARLIAAQAG